MEPLLIVLIIMAILLTAVVVFAVICAFTRQNIYALNKFPGASGRQEEEDTSLEEV